MIYLNKYTLSAENATMRRRRGGLAGTATAVAAVAVALVYSNLNACLAQIYWT